MIYEFCSENYTQVPEKIARGAGRIELCDNLAVGGTTPSIGVLEQTISYAHSKGVSVMTMIRPRGGDFHYNDIELEMMLADIRIAHSLGSDGVVFGALKDGVIDKPATQRLINASRNMAITFHMAFDSIVPDQQFIEMEWLISLGVDRILTHGGSKETNIFDNLVHLNKLIDYASGRIIILPGGGITKDNVQNIHDQLKVNEYHGTKIV